MSDLRERAAIAAMQGLLAKLSSAGEWPHVIACDAVRCADALLAELARTTTSPVRPEPTAGACTAAERELIEAAYMQETSPTDLAWSRYRYAMHSVRAERRAASEAKGGVQP